MSIPCIRAMFWSYLWGIETFPNLRLVCLFQSFDLTYEGLKLSSTMKAIKSLSSFWSYLWGIETPPFRNQTLPKLPFWSYLWGIETICFCVQSDIVFLSFDLTYEGLKHKHINFYLSTHFVLILPMRDWNLFESLYHLIFPLVLILPMRDWN